MKEASGKFVVRIPPALHARLREEARRSGLSLNQLCASRLEVSPAIAARASSRNHELVPQPLLDRVRAQWEKELIGIVMFGSQARGEATAASDTDVLLVFDSKFAVSRSLYSEFDSLVDDVAGEVSAHFVRLPRDPMDAGGLWYEVAVDGLVVWERAFRVSRLLAKIRKAMATGEIRRGVSHGHPYWVRKTAKDR